MWLIITLLGIPIALIMLFQWGVCPAEGLRGFCAAGLVYVALALVGVICAGLKGNKRSKEHHYYG